MYGVWCESLGDVKMLPRGVRCNVLYYIRCCDSIYRWPFGSPDLYVKLFVYSNSWDFVTLGLLVVMSRCSVIPFCRTSGFVCASIVIDFDFRVGGVLLWSRVPTGRV